MNPLHAVNRPSNISLSDALPFAVEPFSKVSSRHRPFLGTAANESQIWQAQSVSFLQSQGRVWALTIPRPLKRGSISKWTNVGVKMKACIWPGTKCRGISARYVNNQPRGEGSRDRSPTPGLALDSGNSKQFRGSGDNSPAPGSAFGSGALAAAECNLRAS